MGRLRPGCLKVVCLRQARFISLKLFRNHRSDDVQSFGPHSWNSVYRGSDLRVPLGHV